MRKILSCEFNPDTACVELCMEDGTLLSIDCTAVENEVAVSYTHLDVYKRQVLRGTPSTVATVATVAERKRWGGILPPHLQGGCPILGHPKSIIGCRDSRHPMPRNRAPGAGAKSVRRTRSHRIKFCVQKGLGALPSTSRRQEM